AAETDRLCYVGNNFGTGALKCNSLCKYFVGVMNKDSRKMEVYDAELFNLQPVFPGDSINEGLSPESQNQSYRDKVDSLIEAFGTTKQKRALSSRRMNQVGSETLQKAMAKAAETIIDTKGLTALVSDVMQTEADDVSLYLPPCHADADKPEDVYRFDDNSLLLSSVDYAALEAPAAAFRDITSEELLKMQQTGSYSLYVLEELKSMPREEKSRDHKARCLWYLQALIKLSFQKFIKRKNALGFECPHVINSKLLKTFTVMSFNKGNMQNVISSSMKAKLIAYVIALALHINHFQTDLTVLQCDMKLSEKKILEVAKAMRLKISKKKGRFFGGTEEDHRIGTLLVPLPKYEQSSRQQKRKKMA
uniref:RNA polymerase I subunit E n=1 Tax=Latimeria chalumnae TaxID=7897 RepID=H3A2G7_LATCH